MIQDLRFKIRERGFTLIEILVVIAIIGILSSLILVGLNGARKQGRDARRVADLRQVQTGLELYFQSKGQYPPNGNWQSIVTALSGAGAGLGINNVPNDPLNAGGWNYAYCTVDQTQYALAAYLEDTNNSALKQSANVPCSPSLVGTPANPACSSGAAVTNKYCQTL
ncbi:MAG: type II secretion system protein [Candidatus Paceibacterota bacterium]|jgi:prepilin-type N-terminal cleavage/methylation domain-containing protein